MQNESGNWLYFSHGREFKKGEKRKKNEGKGEHPQEKHDRWKNVLKRLGEKIDKNIIIWDANYTPHIRSWRVRLLKCVRQPIVITAK